MSLYAKSNKEDINSLMPLLFAAHPELKPSYKKMAELDSKHKRTFVALEHRFRSWRADAKALVSGQSTVTPESTPNVDRKRGSTAVTDQETTPTKKRVVKKGTATPVKKGRKKIQTDDEDGNVDGEGSPGVALQRAFEKTISSHKGSKNKSEGGLGYAEGSVGMAQAHIDGVTDAELLGERPI